MKVFGILFSFVFILCSCNSGSSKKTGEMSNYYALYKDSFDILLHKNPGRLTHVDTLYTEMYIALKSMTPEYHEVSAKMVCEKVDELMVLDTIRLNQIQYLETKQIALSVLRDKDGFIRNCKQLYNLYPENSYERLSSLGSLYLATNNLDSSRFYLDKCIRVSLKEIGTTDLKRKAISVVGVIHAMVLQGKSVEAKSFLHNQIKKFPNGEDKQNLLSIYEDFDGYVEMEKQSIKNFPW